MARSATPQEIALKERAARLGYELTRCGTAYSLIGEDSQAGFKRIEMVEWWLDVIEFEIPMEVTAAPGVNTDVKDGTVH
jgi:hypothetical protein